MREQSYTEQSLAPSATLRFLAAPTDVNWGGKTHGGTVMRWIDEAAYVCAVGWSGSEHCVAAYSGGVRFYKPIRIGDLVEVDARLLYTGRRSMHVSVHVRSGDPRTPEQRVLTTHCLTVFVALTPPAARRRCHAGGRRPTRTAGSRRTPGTSWSCDPPWRRPTRPDPIRTRPGRGPMPRRSYPRRRDEHRAGSGGDRLSQLRERAP